MVDFPATPTLEEAETRYAVTGIWGRAPEQPETPSSGSIAGLYATSIDRYLAGQDAFALPDPVGLRSDAPLAPQLSPLPPGLEFELDSRGVVVASANGTMNPYGVLVYAGKPPVQPPAWPKRVKVGEVETARPDLVAMSKVRPRLRPGDLIEKSERKRFGGLSIAELGQKRPKLRPAAAKEALEQDLTPTKLAVATSIRPRVRPSNFAQIVALATPRDELRPEPAVASVAPSIPTTASVARQATVKNALNLRKINLIGVYGTSSSRRALVRMPSGRYKKVQVGDRLDGGKVAAISDSELRYVKGGRNISLKLPKN